MVVVNKNKVLAAPFSERGYSLNKGRASLHVKRVLAAARASTKQEERRDDPKGHRANL